MCAPRSTLLLLLRPLTTTTTTTARPLGGSRNCAAWWVNKHRFNDIKKNGMGALMKYYNDPKLLTKLGSKLGPVGAPGAGPAGPMAAAAGPAAEPEINNLRDAAK